MPPALAILSQSVFGSILGVPGLVLASPITAALLAVFDKATPPLADATKTQLETNELTHQEIAKNRQERMAATKKEEESDSSSAKKK